MKLKYLLTAVLLMMCTSFQVQAAIGDVVGNIYTTDIAADVDGMPIKSYNIGGRTAVVIEELREYGFYVEWKQDERMLIVKTEFLPQKYPSYSHVKETPGKIAGKIYETDIRVTVNGIEVPSFNLGGITAAAIEDFVDLSADRYSYDGDSHQNMDKPYKDTGMYYVWNSDKRTISLNCLRPGSVVSTEFGDVTITSHSWSVERMTYISSYKALATRDGNYYNTQTPAFELGGETFVRLADVKGVLDGEIELKDSILNLSVDIKNTPQVQYTNSLTAKTCFNILYPIKEQLAVNGNIADNIAMYLYKAEPYVSINALNEVAGKKLFHYSYDLPEECGESLGKILYSKDILYINDLAVNTFLAESGERYIPVDELKKANFGILATPYTRDILSPRNLPEPIDSSNNYPYNYFYEDYEGKGYMCEYYKSLHEVTIDEKTISSVYIHHTDTRLTPMHTA